MKAKETAKHREYNTVQPNSSNLLKRAKETVEHCTYIHHNIAQTHNTT